MNIKVLKVHLTSLYGLFNFIHDLYKLEELYVSISELQEYVMMNPFPIPRSLSKLHFEFGRFQNDRILSDFQPMRFFLSQFRNQLQSLTLIVTSSAQEFTDFSQLKLLEKSFLYLTSFEYLIHTTHCSSDKFDHIEKLPNDTYLIYTKKPDRPVSFAQQCRNEFVDVYSFRKSFQLNGLYNVTALNMAHVLGRLDFNFDDINYKLPNLRYISYDISKTVTDSIYEMKVLSALLSLSPKLNFLALESSDWVEMKRVLTDISHLMKHIDHLSCKCINSLFIGELARIVSHIKYLYLQETIDEHECTESKIQDITQMINQVDKSFKNLINWNLCIIVRNIDIREKLKLWLDEQFENLFVLEYKERNDYEEIIFSILL